MFNVKYQHIREGKFTTIIGAILFVFTCVLMYKSITTVTEGSPLLLLSLYLMGIKDPRIKTKTKSKCDEHNNEVH